MTNSTPALNVETLRTLIIKKDDSLFTKIKEFVESAEKFNAGECSQDVVLEYLQMSVSCREILELIKSVPSITSKDILVLMQVLTCFLVRIASDLNEYSRTGSSFVTEVLSHASKPICGLVKSAKDNHVRIILICIASMIAQGSESARNVFSKLNLPGRGFSSLLERSNPNKEEDIRSLFINIIVLLLNVGDNNLIRQVVEAKGFLNSVFPRIQSDRSEVIILLLKTFSTKILTNAAIGKTSKIRLFNDFTLKYVLQLYSWKGPLIIRKSFKRKLGDDDGIQQMEVEEEDATLVQQSAHEFLKMLCCSFRYGIIFRDHLYGSMGKNQNHIITSLLKSFPNPYSNPLVCELVASVLKTCPDQIKYYLPELKDSLVPRLSVPWVEAINLLKKIIQAQDYVACLFKSEKRSRGKLPHVAKAVCFPDVLDQSHLIESCETHHPYVTYCLLDYLLVMVNRAKAVIKYCLNPDDGDCYTSEELSEFSDKYVSSLAAALPGVQHLETYWSRVVVLDLPKYEEEMKKSLPGYEVPDGATLLSQVLKFLDAYYVLRPKSFHNIDAMFHVLFTGLMKSQECFGQKDISSLKFQLMNLLVARNTLKKSVWDKAEFSPASFIMDIYVSVCDPDVTYKIESMFHKILSSSKFDGSEWEINIWLRELRLQKKRHATLIEFLDGILQTLYDRDCENDLEMKLNGDEQLPLECRNKVESNGRDFSCLVPAALLHLDSLQNKACKKYIQSVLQHIFHHQADPKSLFSIVSKHHTLFSSLQWNYWEFLCSAKCIDMPEDCGQCSSLNEELLHEFISFHSSHNKITHDEHYVELHKKIRDVPTYEASGILWQLLSYIKFEYDTLLENEKCATNIPFYLCCLEDIIESKVLPVLVDADIDKSSWKFTEALSLSTDILSHPGVLKCFLPSNKDYSQYGEHKISVCGSVSDLVFQLLTTKAFQGNKPLLLLLKNAAVSFCNINMLSNLKDDLCASFKWDAFQKSILAFSSVLTVDETIALLHQLLSVTEVFETFDSKGHVFSMLVHVYEAQQESGSLSENLVVDTLSSIIELKQKKKRSHILKESLLKLLKAHPHHVLKVPLETAYLLLNKQSMMYLDILIFLMKNNSAIKEGVYEEIMKHFTYQVAYDESFIFHLVVKSLREEFVVAEDGQFLQSSTSFLWSFITHKLLMESADLEELFEDVPRITSLMIENKFLSFTEMQEIAKILNKSSGLPSFSKASMWLQIFHIFCYDVSCQEMPGSLQKHLFRFLITWIEHGIELKQCKERDELLISSLDLFLLCIKSSGAKIVKKVFNDDMKRNTFIQQTLKVALRDADVGSQLLKMLKCLIETLYENVPDESDFTSRKEEIQNIYALLTSHSNFCPIMLKSSALHRDLKGAVVDMLITLVHKNSSICHLSHVPLLLSAYSASLNRVDQSLLFLLKLYEDNKVSVLSYSPFMWGPSAISHYSLQKKEQHSIWKQAKMQEVLGLFERDLLEYTLRNYPLEINLEPTRSSLVLSSGVTWEKVYDPRFVLPLLGSLLSPGSYVNCHAFIESNVLAIIFGSLSSSDADTRSLGYYCLSQFYNHLESSMYGQRKIWISVLDSVRNSIEGYNPRIPCIVTLFLHKAVHILSRPDNPLYSSIYKFLMVKPELDIGQVPEFYKLFNSIEIDYRLHRSWLLSLLEEGLRTSLDFHICQKRFIFTIILPYCCSSLCTDQDKMKILRILMAVVKINSSAKTMCQSGLLAWLHSVIRSNDGEVLEVVSKIMDTLWATLQQNESNSDSRPMYSSFSSEFELVKQSLQERLRYSNPG